MLFVLAVVAAMFASDATVKKHRYCESINYREKTLCGEPMRIVLHTGEIINDGVR
jgi:hypothetical protein